MAGWIVLSLLYHWSATVTVAGDLWHFGDRGDRGLQDQEAAGSTDYVLFIVSTLYHTIQCKS